MKIKIFAAAAALILCAAVVVQNSSAQSRKRTGQATPPAAENPDNAQNAPGNQDYGSVTMEGSGQSSEESQGQNSQEGSISSRYGALKAVGGSADAPMLVFEGTNAKLYIFGRGADGSWELLYQINRSK